MELAVGCVMCAAAAAMETGHGGDRAGASAVAMRELWEKTGAMQAWRRGIRQVVGRVWLEVGGGKGEAEPSGGDAISRNPRRERGSSA